VCICVAADDGTVEGEDGDIWNVCDIDGLTGNVVATDKSRRVLYLNGGFVEVPDFSHAPSEQASLAFWMQVSYSLHLLPPCVCTRGLMPVRRLVVRLCCVLT
jgi:hypothetical protein